MSLKSKRKIEPLHLPPWESKSTDSASEKKELICDFQFDKEFMSLHPIFCISISNFRLSILKFKNMISISHRGEFEKHQIHKNHF